MSSEQVGTYTTVDEGSEILGRPQTDGSQINSYTLQCSSETSSM